MFNRALWRHKSVASKLAVEEWSSFLFCLLIKIWRGAFKKLVHLFCHGQQLYRESRNDWFTGNQIMGRVAYISNEDDDEWP